MCDGSCSAAPHCPAPPQNSHSRKRQLFKLVPPFRLSWMKLGCVYALATNAKLEVQSLLSFTFRSFLAL
jgi:hypothetical protein